MVSVVLNQSSLLSDILNSPFDRLLDLLSRLAENESLKQNARQAAVISILIQEPTEEPKIVLIKRNDYDGHHSGQMAFPGGKKEDSDENLKQTAIREVEEEIGIRLLEEQLIELNPHWVHVSNFWIQPYFVILDKKLDYRINKREINRIFEIPVSFFQDPANLLPHEVSYNGQKILSPSFSYEGNLIWGATALIMYQLFHQEDNSK
jgi:8-oxo-dGTP pyrophosphatase MutT (NUDIX family)